MKQAEFESLLLVEVADRAAAEPDPPPGTDKCYGRPWLQLRDEMVACGAQTVAELRPDRITAFYYSTNPPVAGPLNAVKGLFASTDTTRGRTAHASPAERRAAIIGIVVLVALAVGLGVSMWTQGRPSAYQDGLSWARTWRTALTRPQSFPGCKLSYMASPESRQIERPGHGADFSAAGEPDDNYPQWRAGCESARSTY